MIRGKLPKEGDLIKQMPGVHVSGDLSRLKPGQRIMFELMVVAKKTEANSSVDFVFLNKELNFSGLFKTNSFVMLNDDGKTDLLDFISSNSIAIQTSNEFHSWIQHGNVPLYVEFNRAEMMANFLDEYPCFIGKLTNKKFSGWVSAYANWKGHKHNSNCRTEKGWSLIA